MAQLGEVVKLETPISFFKRVNIVNDFGKLVEEFEEYLVKGYIDKKIVKYNATMGELTRYSNQIANEIEFLVFNYRVPTVAKKVSDGTIVKNLDIQLGDQVSYKEEKFQIYNIIDVDKHAYRTCDLVSYHYPVTLDNVDEDVQKFWYSYLQELGLGSFRDFPHWQITHMYELMDNDFATYEISYVSNKDDDSVLASTTGNNTNSLDYNFRFRRFVDVIIKVYSNTKNSNLDFALRNQKAMYLINKFEPTYFYNWGILEAKTRNLGSKYVIINGKNVLQTSYRVRFGYTADYTLKGDYINNVVIDRKVLGGD